MAISQAQTDLDQRITGTAIDAARVGNAMRLFPMVLLRHDVRVQHAYDVWRQRAERYEDAGRPEWLRSRQLANAGPCTEASALRFLFESSVQLNALVRELKLQRYQSWLPAMLAQEFHRTLEGASQVDVTLPTGLAWYAKGRAPKQGETHREDLERSLTWFYRHQVQQHSKYILQREYIDSRRRDGVTITAAKRQINNGLKRAAQLLACIDAPFPQ